MDTDIIKVLEFIANFTSSFWLYAAFIIFIVRQTGREPYQSVRTIYHELKPFYLPCVITGYILGSMIEVHDGWDVVFFMIAIAAYWLYKNIDKDDRWQKRKEKIMEKIEQVGSKLAVVPT